MVKWEKHRLGDVIELIGGGTPKTSVPEYWNGGIPWLSVKDLGQSFWVNHFFCVARDPDLCLQ